LPSDRNESKQYQLAALTEGGAPIKLAVIAAVVLSVAGCFAYVAGWLSPHRLTPARMIDAFEQANGIHPGFRRNHAKGVCVTGSFASNGAGARLSKASVFQAGQVLVIGRFALAGGQPDMADGPKAVRSMALSFRPPGGEEWRTGMNDIAVFPLKTPESFYEQLLASKPDPTTGRPDPAKLQAFLASHPETVRALQTMNATPFSSGFANATYNSLDAFRFVNAAGKATPVRWSMSPVERFAPETADQAAAQDKNYLFDALIARLARTPLQWHLVVSIAAPGDPTDDATIAWPQNREQVDVGTLTIDRIEGEARGTCRDINFDPLVLPSGIEPSDDPLLGARSAAYAQSFRRRESETKSRSAIQPPGSGGKGT